jgi:hypothetical protein
MEYISLSFGLIQPMQNACYLHLIRLGLYKTDKVLRDNNALPLWSWIMCITTGSLIQELFNDALEMSVYCGSSILHYL